MKRDKIKKAFEKLSREEQILLLKELTKSHQRNSELLLSRREKLNNKQAACPHCDSIDFRKHGIDKGSQRYKCKSCGRTFTEYTGTWMHGLHNKELAPEYMKLMERELSLDKIKDELKINKKTAFDWRHKILSGLHQKGDRSFKGITESDETFLAFSEKGQNIKDRCPKDRGGVKGKGINDNHVAVIVTTDRLNQSDLSVVCRGRITKKDIEAAIGELITPQTVLCSDGHVSYKGWAKDKGIEHHPLRADLKQRVIKGVYHIQNVNSIDSHLKRWLSGRFYGVSTKYLQNYLNWFRTKSQLRNSSNFMKEFAEIALDDVTASNSFKRIAADFERLKNNNATLN